MTGGHPRDLSGGLHLGRDEPDLFWGPWVGHWFPGMTPARMGEVDIHQYIAMHDFAKRNSG